MIFKNISNISIDNTSVSHTLIYLWQLTSFIKTSTACFDNQNVARGVLYECISEGKVCLQKSFDGILFYLIK